MNLIAPRSVLPFWNRLGERIQKSVVTEGVNIFNFRGEILMNGLEPKVLANKCAKISNKLLIAVRDLRELWPFGKPTI